jgi:hypothetical protein
MVILVYFRTNLCDGKDPRRGFAALLLEITTTEERLFFTIKTGWYDFWKFG